MTGGKPPARKRRLRRRLALLAFGLIASIATAEIALRVYSSWRFPRIRQLDSALGWRHVPGARREFVNEDGTRAVTVINALGHRGPAVPRERVAGKRRLLVLGDSFTEGTNVAESELYTARIAAALPDLEVINTGCGAYSTVQEYLLLRDKWLAYRPDLVLYAFYDNDLTENCLSYYAGIGPRPYAVVEGDAVRIVEDYGDADFAAFLMPAPFRTFLFRHSALYRSLHKNVYQTLCTEELQHREWRGREAIDGPTRLRTLYGVLAKMRELVGSERIDLAVTLIPTREQVARGDAPALAAIAEHCRDAGIACLSLLPALRAASTDGGAAPYFARDIHWTARGHAVAARALSPFLAPLLPD